MRAEPSSEAELSDSMLQFCGSPLKGEKEGYSKFKLGAKRHEDVHLDRFYINATKISYEFHEYYCSKYLCYTYHNMNEIFLGFETVAQFLKPTIKYFLTLS